MKKLLFFAFLITFYTYATGQSSRQLAKEIKGQTTVITQLGTENLALKNNVAELQSALIAILSKKDTTIQIGEQTFQVIVKDGVALVSDGKAVFDEAAKSNPKGVVGWLLAIFAAVMKFGGFAFLNSLLVRAQKIAVQAKGIIKDKPRFVLYAMAGSVVAAVILEAANGGVFDLLTIPSSTSYIFLASVAIYELGIRPFQKWRLTK